MAAKLKEQILPLCDKSKPISMILKKIAGGSSHAVFLHSGVQPLVGFVAGITEKHFCGFGAKAFV